MKRNFRALELVAKKFIETYSAGIHSTLLHDSLIEVDVIREYQPGDKRLDSRASFKTGKSMARVFNPERSLNLFVILDLSSSQYTKLDAAVTTVLYLCYLGEMCEEKMGLCVFSDKVSRIILPSEDYSFVKNTVEHCWNNMQMEMGSNVREAVEKVSNLFLGNSLVVLVSDYCYDIDDKFLNSVKKIANIKTNSFLHIVLYNQDDWLLNIKGNVSLTLKDAENSSCTSIDCNNTKNIFNDWRNKLKSKLLKTHGDMVFLNAKDRNFLLPLVKYLLRN